MPYYAVANLVTVTKTNMIDEMACGYGTIRTAAVSIGTKTPAELCRGLSSSNIWLSYKSILVVS